MKITLKYTTARYALMAFFASAAIGAPQVVRAAEMAATNATSDSLEEIVVTAQKRQQNINDVGQAITALSGDALQERGIANVRDLVKIEPSLQFTVAETGQPVYTIRGVGFNDKSLAAASTVSIYQDEVGYAFPILSKASILDVERVEVLKGPQGILYGQNATGGAINFIAAKPTPAFDAGINATYGRFNAASLDGFVSGPLTDTLAARLAVRTDQGGAWQRSDTRNEMLGNKDLKEARLLIDWKPITTFKAELNVNGFTDDSDAQAPQLRGIRFIDPSYISPETTNHAPVAADYATYPASIQGLVNNKPAPADPQAADWQTGTHPQLHEGYFETTLRLDYDPSDVLGFTSLSKYETFSETNFIDMSGVNVLNTSSDVHGNAHSYSEELRAHGLLDDKKIEWLLGFGYSKTLSYENDYTPAASSGTYLTGGSAFSVLPAFLGATAFKYFGVYNVVDTTEKSAFANIEYHPLESLGVHAGIRVTRNNASLADCTNMKLPGNESLINYILTPTSEGLTGTAQPLANANPLGCVTFLPSGATGLYQSQLNETNVPWRTGVDWKPDPGSLVYVSVSRGFKAGGSPALGAATYNQLAPVTQEEVTAYELGAKARLFDRKLAITGALFHYDYKNKQFLGRIPDPLGLFGALQALVNVPTSTEDGAELAATWRPIHDLTLDAAATYLNSSITSNFLNYSPYTAGPTDTINLKGEQFPFTPKWSLSFGARYDWTINENWGAFTTANLTYQSRTVSTFGAGVAALTGPNFNIDPYALLDLSAGVVSNDGHWTASLWGKNVTNKYYLTNIYYNSGDTVNNYTGMPATYGLTVSYRY